MKYVYSFVWAALCAWMVIWLIGYFDAKVGFLNDFCFPQIISFIHGYGLSAKTVAFLAIFLIFWATGIHKIVGRGILFLIGWTCIIILVGLALICGYAFLSWIISLL